MQMLSQINYITAELKPILPERMGILVQIKAHPHWEDGYLYLMSRLAIRNSCNNLLGVSKYYLTSIIGSGFSVETSHIIKWKLCG